MKTYQIFLKGDQTRYVLADGYREHDHMLVFHVGERVIEQVESTKVIMVDELGETPGFLTTVPIEVRMSIPFQ
jgi:hypothetical protein